MIKIVNLHKSFGHLKVLRGINEEIKPGEVVSVIGPSGSGKSTFLRCINLLEEPTEGDIYIEGEKSTIREATSTNCAARLAWYFSSSIFFPTKT